MSEPSESGSKSKALREKIIGLGEHSIRKSYYPDLRKRMAELERFRALLDHTRDSIFLMRGPEGRFVDVNDSACRHLGLSRENLLLMTMDAVFAEPVVEWVRRLFEQETGADRPATIDTEPVSISGSVLAAEITLRRAQFSDANYVVAGARDLSERKRAETALRESELKFRKLYEESKRAEEIYRSLLNSSVDAIVIYDMEGNATYVNDSFTKTFGWTVEEVRGKRVEYVPPSEREATTATIGSVMQQGIPCSRFETRRYSKGGRTLEVSISASRFHDADGNPAGMLVILRDITARKRAERLMIQTERLKAVGDMASGVAHNFNNLLQIVIGRVEMALNLLESGNIGKAKTSLGHVLESSRLGAQTVKRLQDLARVRTEDPTLDGAVFDLADVADVAIEMSRPWLQAAADKEGTTISLNRRLQGGCLVSGNENELFDVVVNLIKNAAEALAGQGEIEVTTELDGNTVALSVRDNGPGIAEQNIERIFEPFWTTKGSAGTGLGLATSYGIVRRHGGSLSVNSAPGRGATFTLKLPVATDVAEKTGREPKALSVQKLRVLVIDDMEPVLRLLEDGLSELGHTVFTASSGKEGIRIVENSEVDLIICDLGMPEMNGWQVAGTVKDISRRKGVRRPPFILLTGWGGQMDEREKMSESGVDEVVEKPVDLARLLRVVYETFEKTAAGVPAEST